MPNTIVPGCEAVADALGGRASEAVSRTSEVEAEVFAPSCREPLAHDDHVPVSPARRVRAPATTRNDPDVQGDRSRTVDCHEDLPIDGQSRPTGGPVMTQ